MDGEIWSGAFDFTVLRPVNTQFFTSFRKWRLFALFDLVLGVGVLVTAVIKLGGGGALAREDLVLPVHAGGWDEHSLCHSLDLRSIDLLEPRCAFYLGV